MEYYIIYSDSMEPLSMEKKWKFNSKIMPEDEKEELIENNQNAVKLALFVEKQDIMQEIVNKKDVSYHINRTQSE